MAWICTVKDARCCISPPEKRYSEKVLARHTLPGRLWRERVCSVSLPMPKSYDGKILPFRGRTLWSPAPEIRAGAANSGKNIPSPCGCIQRPQHSVALGPVPCSLACPVKPPPPGLDPGSWLVRGEERGQSRRARLSAARPWASCRLAPLGIRPGPVVHGITPYYERRSIQCDGHSMTGDQSFVGQDPPPPYGRHDWAPEG